MQNNFNRSLRRVVGNFMTAFLSPLMGTSVAFNLDYLETNEKILLSALISASVVAGLVIAREIDRGQ